MRTATAIRTAAGFLLTIAACRSEMPKLDQVSPDSATVSNALPEAASTTVPDISTWKLSPKGLGPLHAGMSVAQVRTIIPRLDAPADLGTAECTYARSSSLPPGAVLMFAKGALVRVDILSGRVQTDLGARLGDTEDQVEMLYGSSIKTSPHKYTDGHYLTFAESAADTAFRIVFETDGSRVLRYRSGRMPEVEWVEGCS